MTQAEEIVKLLREQGAGCITQMTVWTECYRPFMMGGDVNRPIKTTVSAMGPFDLGKDYKGFIVTHPASEKTFIAESETGAFVGPDLDSVRADIADADMDYMRQQISQAKIRVAEAEQMEPEEFWRLMQP